MTARGVKIAGCCVVLAVIQLVGVSASPQAAPSTKRSVGQIAQARLDLAEQGYQTELQRYQRGLTSGVNVSQWLRRRALGATDLPDAAKKVDVLRDYLDGMKQDVARLERSAAAGAASQEDLLMAKDRELEAELWLAKAGD